MRSGDFSGCFQNLAAKKFSNIDQVLEWFDSLDGVSSTGVSNENHRGMQVGNGQQRTIRSNEHAFDPLDWNFVLHCGVEI